MILQNYHKNVCGESGYTCVELWSLLCSEFLSFNVSFHFDSDPDRLMFPRLSMPLNSVRWTQVRHRQHPDNVVPKLVLPDTLGAPLYLRAGSICWCSNVLAVVELDLQPTTPDLVGHLEILIHSILPDKSQEEVNDILEMRCEVPEDPIGDLVPDADVQEAMFPEEDSKHLKAQC